jgi:hypothetical protein
MFLWNYLFRLGLLGLIVVSLSLLVVGVSVLGTDVSQVHETSEFWKFVRVAGFGTYLAVGLVLIVPCFISLNKSKDLLSSFQRTCWTLFILIFWFITPYIYFYFRLYRRK